MPNQTPEEIAEDKRYNALIRELAALLNRYSVENRSNTPDFMLAEFMLGCLNVYENTIRARYEWRAPIEPIEGDTLDPFRRELTQFLRDNQDRMTPPVLRENLIQLFAKKDV